MSKLICCDFCGTIFDPEKDVCPTCGSRISGQSAASLSQSDTASDTVADDLFSNFDFETDQPEEDEPSVADFHISLTEKPEPPMADDGGIDISDIWGSGRAPKKSTPESGATTVAPVRRKAAPSPVHTAASMEASSVAPQPKPDPIAAAPAQNDEETQAAKGSRKPRKKRAATGKDKVICIVLATLVLLLGMFILYRFLRPGLSKPETPDTQGTESTRTADTTEADIRCTAIAVGEKLSFFGAGETQPLRAVFTPADTTELPQYTSSDPAVATVDENGIVTAVGDGEAQITISCGSITASCTVVCSIAPPETTEATEETEPPTEETEPTDPTPASLELNRTDITFFNEGESFRLRAGEYDSLVTWRSDNTSVATVKNGKVTAVGSGTTRIHAIYGDLDVSCIVRCKFADDTQTELTEPSADTEPSETTAPTDAPEPTVEETEPTTEPTTEPSTQTEPTSETP